MSQFSTGADAGESSSSARPGTAAAMLLRDRDSEFDQSQHHHKHSVLNRVKEKARRWRHTLSKKKRNETHNAVSSRGVTMDEEMKPEGGEYNANTKHGHPRTGPVIPRKHVLQSSVMDHSKQGKQIQHSQGHNILDMTSASPAVSKKPASADNDDAALAMASRIHNISITNPARVPGSVLYHATAGAPEATEPSPMFHDAPVSTPDEVPGSAEGTSSRKLIWDKGVSVKEYLKQKLDPGEDERALSQVISDAMCPRGAPGNAGVVEKMRDVVTSLLQQEESSAPAIDHLDKTSSSQISVSTKPPEVVGEESHGRVLQTN